MNDHHSKSALEAQFFRDLKLITTLLIKNGSKLYRYVLPIVQSHEDKTWFSKTDAARHTALSELATLCCGEGEINRFFEDFPHDWTRRKYSEFKQNLDQACTEQ